MVAQIRNLEENSITYEIYSLKTNSLIATVDEQGKLHFLPDYIEQLKQVDKNYVSLLTLENLDFKMPQELGQKDKILTWQERQQKIAKEKQKHQQVQQTQKAKEDQAEQERLENEEVKTSEKEQKEKIARQKKIPEHNIVMIKKDSNFYKDHPNLEDNLYFYRDAQGVVKAEFIDENGIAQTSKHFENSTTNLRKQTVSLGTDGNPVTKQIPYQTMKTKGLNHVDKDIREIQIAIEIDQYGYLEIAENRQGRNGEWLSHQIEVRGRTNNASKINEATSIKTRDAQPDKQIEAYRQVEEIGLAVDGVQYDEMYLMGHAQEVIDGFIREGYQKKEAVQIFDYMIGEEKLSLRDAKDRVNAQIEKSFHSRANTKEQKEIQTEQDTRIEEALGEERTPWGDAKRREKR